MPTEGGAAGLAAPAWRLARARVLGWAALVALVGFQVWALYVASGTGTALFPHADKVGHLTMFGLPALVAGLLGSRAAVVALLVHAVVAEPVQGWVTEDRVTDAWDTVANLTGVTLGAAAAALSGRRR